MITITITKNNDNKVAMQRYNKIIIIKNSEATPDA